MNDENLIHAYNELLTLADKLLGQDIKAVEIAPILVKLGLEIYKTILSADEYDKMVDFISNKRDDIQNLRDFMPELH